MKKNHVVAGLIGAVLLAGSTLSIAAASTSKDWNRFEIWLRGSKFGLPL